ncbi:hypothetical protein [Halospeciosus flavus]|uniref:hypothetical protein n=1 Tax=Halospeciosus flavus TaxID=3032283 RepID=UPI00361907A6
MTASRRSFLRATGGTAAGLALAGCASTDQPESSTTTAEPGSDRDLRQTGTTLVTLDPAASADGASNRVVTQLYDGLVHFPHATLPPNPSSRRTSASPRTGRPTGSPSTPTRRSTPASR